VRATQQRIFALTPRSTGFWSPVLSPWSARLQFAMKSTDYFRSSVLPRRPYIRNHWIERVLRQPIRTQVQTNGRIRHWALIPEVGRYLRVVTEADGQTVHNAFLDRGFKP